jgi:hypothetical protein
MILLSNNALKYVDLPPGDTVVRVNVAWCGDNLAPVLERLKGRNIFVDYPEGRTKPPRTTISINTAVSIIRLNTDVKYFAVSNAEDPGRLEHLRLQIPESVIIVPKIESMRGVRRVREISKAAQTDIIMLDAEDLYADAKDLFEEYCTLLNTLCGKNIRVLRMRGVIFSDQEYA